MFALRCGSNPADSMAPTSKDITLKAPNDAVPGAEMAVGDVKITIPEGVEPGEEFKVTVPSPPPSPAEGEGEASEGFCATLCGCC